MVTSSVLKLEFVWLNAHTSPGTQQTSGPANVRKFWGNQRFWGNNESGIPPTARCRCQSSEAPPPHGLPGSWLSVESPGTSLALKHCTLGHCSRPGCYESLADVQGWPEDTLRQLLQWLLTRVRPFSQQVHAEGGRFNYILQLPYDLEQSHWDINFSKTRVCSLMKWGICWLESCHLIYPLRFFTVLFTS